MPYVRRNTLGQIESLHRQAEGPAPEFLADEHPDVQAFVGRPPADDFTRLDADFVRVLEDVIDALIAKHVITVTDMPAEAQAKLFARKSFRERAAQRSLRLFDEPASGGVIGDAGAGRA